MRRELSRVPHKPALLAIFALTLLAVFSAGALAPMLSSSSPAVRNDFIVNIEALSNRYLVLNGNAPCSPTHIASDMNCWSETNGGVVGATVPGDTERVFITDQSGDETQTATLDTEVKYYSFDSTGFRGTFATGDHDMQIHTTMKIRGTFLAMGAHIIMDATTGVSSLDIGMQFNYGTSSLQFGGDTNTFTVGGPEPADPLLLALDAPNVFNVFMFNPGALHITGNYLMHLAKDGTLDLEQGTTTGVGISIDLDGIGGGVSNLNDMSGLSVFNLYACSPAGVELNFPGTNGFDLARVNLKTRGPAASTSDCGSNVNTNMKFDLGGPLMAADMNVNVNGIASEGIITLNAGDSVFGANSLVVGPNGGFMRNDGVRASDFDIHILPTSHDAPVIDAVMFGDTFGTWVAYHPQSQAPGAIKWSMTLMNPSADVFMKFNSMVPGHSYTLLRGQTAVATSFSNGAGSNTFVVHGGWDNTEKAMTVQFSSVGGGGGSTPPTQPGQVPFQGITFGGLQFHDGLVIIPGLVTIVLLAVLARLWGYGVATTITIAAAEVIALLGISLSFGPGLDEYLSVVGAFVGINILGGAILHANLKKGIVLSIVGAVTFGLLLLGFNPPGL